METGGYCAGRLHGHSMELRWGETRIRT